MRIKALTHAKKETYAPKQLVEVVGDAAYDGAQLVCSSWLLATGGASKQQAKGEPECVGALDVNAACRLQRRSGAAGGCRLSKVRWRRAVQSL